MEKSGRTRQWAWILGSLAMAALLFFSLSLSHHSTNPPSRRVLRDTNFKYNNLSGVKIYTHNHINQVVIDNGIIQLTLSTPDGDVIGIKYNELDEVLDTSRRPHQRAYWDVLWNRPGEHYNFDTLWGTSFEVIMANEDQVEVSFIRRYDVLNGNRTAPFSVDKRFIVRRGSSGFYTYTIFERQEGWPAVEMGELRNLYRLRKDKFHYMAISDERQRIMPSDQERSEGEQLDYVEAVLTHPNDPKRREVDDKYMYSNENKDMRVHGWISFDPAIGFWIIAPSDESRIAGPLKQDLTGHVGPIILSMFTSAHYAGGKDVSMNFPEGESWKKVYGPIFIYLNSVSNQEDPLSLWQDAKEQMLMEIDSWPYNFIQSEDFPTSSQRGMIAGQLQVRDRYINEKLMPAKTAYVGLALPGDVGSWQRECKGYQFWTRTDENGYFLIKNVRAGVYNLYAWVPGFIGDYKFETNITVEQGSKIKLDSLVYEPPRQGPTLWEIGVPDRSAAEFFVPDPYPNLTNPLYNGNFDRFRQYGLWRRYKDLYPNHDLVYTIGVDNYTNSWFYAHVTRDTGNNTFQATTWEIRFQLENVDTRDYTLQLALAAASQAEIQVRVNNPYRARPHFTTRLIGNDNAIARHGIHGLYWLYSINVPSNSLVNGDNSIYLTQSRHMSPFQGVMYDYIRLEGPPNS